jgi:hypothetical protein
MCAGTTHSSLPVNPVHTTGTTTTLASAPTSDPTQASSTPSTSALVSASGVSNDSNEEHLRGNAVSKDNDNNNITDETDRRCDFPAPSSDPKHHHDPPIIRSPLRRVLDDLLERERELRLQRLGRMSAYEVERKITL